MRIKYCILTVAILITSCNKKTVDYDKIASYQDIFIKKIDVTANENTRVLLIFPHADDEILCAGLTAYFKQQGAIIHLLTLGHNSETINNEIRMKELKCSTEKLGIENVEIAGLITNSWNDIKDDNIKFWYANNDSIKSIIHHKIDRFKPQILITFDTEIGGFGHPEHRISAQLTEELFYRYKSDTSFHSVSIYQFTLPEKMEHFILNKVPGYELAKQLTGSEGLPEPDVSLNILPYWPLKNEAALCHKTQFNTLSKFYMVAEKENLEAHSNAFNSEYYTIIK